MKHCPRSVSTVLFLAAFLGIVYSLYSPLEHWWFSRRATQVVGRVTHVKSWSEDVATVPGVWDMNAEYQDATVVFTAPTGNKVLTTLHRVQGMRLGKELTLLVHRDQPGVVRPWIRWVVIAVESVLFLKVSLMLLCFAAAATPSSRID